VHDSVSPVTGTSINAAFSSFVSQQVHTMGAKGKNWVHLLPISHTLPRLPPLLYALPWPSCHCSRGVWVTAVSFPCSVLSSKYHLTDIQHSLYEIYRKVPATVSHKIAKQAIIKFRSTLTRLHKCAVTLICPR